MPGFWPPIKKFPRQCFSNVFLSQEVLLGHLGERDRKKDKHVTDEHESEDEVSNLLGCFPAVEKEICEKEERLLG